MSNPAIEIAARYIENHSETLVQSWIDWVRERVQTETVTALPERALRNHVPPVLRSIAKYIRNPIQLAREELLGHLRLHAQIRRDQGYSLQEVLAEFDGLADLVTRGVNRAICEGAEAATSTEFLEVATRLAEGLRSISFITVGTYGESDEERMRSFSAGLEEFARAVAHELRNPLNTLALTIELLRHEIEPGERRAHADVMEAAVKRAASLTDTIQMLAVAEQARSGERLVAVSEAIVRMVEEFKDDAHLGGVEIRPETAPPDVRVEATLVYIVLANLVGNSIKYHDPSKDVRWVSISTRVIAEEHDSGFCEICVEDNGIGVPAELLPRLRQRGFRAHPEHAQGTGLGLYIVQQALGNRGGELQIESDESVGTKVSARMRCLQGQGDALSAERFSVETLMGRRSAGDEGPQSPRLPEDEGDGKEPK